MSKALANKIKLNNIYDAKTFGATGDGTTNDTAALQAALNAAMAVNGTLYIPAGTYRFSTLSITDNVHITGDEPSGTVLRQISGANTNAIVIDGAVVQNPIIENLTIDGNRSGNSSGNGIHLPDSALSYGFAVALYNVYVQNVAGDCLYVGTNRNMGHVENTELKRGGRCLYIKDASDWRFVHSRHAFPLTGPAIQVDSGAVNVFIGGAAYGATLAPAVYLTSIGPSPTQFLGMTINNNDREGVHIVGFSGAARTIGHTFIGCAIGGNSLSATNTYSNVKLEDTKAAIFVGNYFQGTSGNVPKYLVEFVGAASVASWVGNTYETSSYGTAVSNSPALLESRVQRLVSEQETVIGGDEASSCSLLVAKGTAAGNYVAVTGRAAGTPPDIAPRGVDTNIGLRLYTKGTGAIELSPGSLTRAARFMQVASAVNYIDFYGSATGQPLQIFANGSDTNIDIRLVPKGTGRVRYGTHTATVDTAVSGYIEIVDSGGTVRKLAVIT